MRRSVLAALLATMLLTWPAQAQSTERTLLDMELWMGRSEQSGCMNLPPGDLSIVTAISQAPAFPSTANVNLKVYSMMGSLGGEYLEMAITETPTTSRRAIAGGPYCWFVESSYSSPNTGQPHITLKMTLTSQ